MPRHAKPTFHSEFLAQLARQLLFSPQERRREQIARAEQLHDELDPGLNYPSDFVAFRLTGYRREDDDQTLLVGQAVLADLRQMIDVLSRSMPVPVDEGEAVESAEDLAARLNVSTKSLSRWRKLGLRRRWVAPPGQSQKRLVYPRQAVERFLQRQQARVQRAGRYTYIDAPTRERIIARARRIAMAQDVSLNRVAGHLARRTGRAIETIRLVLARHDQEHARDPIFIDRTGPLSARQKRVIARAGAKGVPVGKIAAHFQRTRATIYRVIHERRLAELGRARLEHFELPTFDRDDADEVYFDPPLPAAAVPTRVPVDDLPEAIRPLYRQPALDPEQEQMLLVRLNYSKHRARAILAQADRQQPRAGDLDRAGSLIGQATQIRQRLTTASLPRVLAAARRHLVGQPERSLTRLLELLEQGTAVLIEAVDGFDITRNVPFESYLTWCDAALRGGGRDVGPQGTEAKPQAAAGTGGAEGGGQDGSRTKAHRRQTPENVLHRMIDKAGESGIDLAKPPSAAEPP